MVISVASMARTVNDFQPEKMLLVRQLSDCLCLVLQTKVLELHNGKRWVQVQHSTVQHGHVLHRHERSIVTN